MLPLFHPIFRFAALAISALSFTSTGNVPILSSGTLSVGNNNIFYTDTGAPSGKASYTTVFLVHGMFFNSGVFSKSQSSDLRLVAINRRGYQRSTPYSTDELSVISNGTVAQRDNFLTNRGVEIAIFIDSFMQEKEITSGGIAIVGWSLGNLFTLATISSVNLWPSEVKSRLAPRMQALIMQEPSAEILGFTSNPKNWIPLIDVTIPAETRGAMTAQWISHYFNHGDFTRDPDSISWVVPSITRTPSVFRMSTVEHNSIVELGTAPEIDLSIVINLAPQLHEAYRNAIFGAAVKAAFPQLKRSFFTGDVSVSFGPYAYFLVKNDTATAGDSSVSFIVVPGVNHFVNWDDPEIAVEIYSRLV